MQPDEAAPAEARTVQDEAERLLGSKPDPSLTDAEVKRLVVQNLLDDASERSDSFVDGAFQVLATMDVRLATARREMRRAAAARQIRQLEQMQPEGKAN